MNKLVHKSSCIAMAFLLAFSTVFWSFRVEAAEVDKECKIATAVFARGSGQSIGQEKGEAAKFREQLEERIGKDKLNFYELGTESYGGGDNIYQAVDVSNVFNGNAIGAGLSGGMGNDYGRSVAGGVAELQEYLRQRNTKCPKEFFILGGLSQGAQVVSQSFSGLPTKVIDRIVFSAMFGDPKLYLPEGEGFIPPACRGEKLSHYRRDITNCHVDNGALGARKPYLPSENIEKKSGLWCLAKDFICGSSKTIWNNSGHGKYGEGNGPIDSAASEAALRLSIAIKKEQYDHPPYINTKPANNNQGTTGTDVVFVLDTTGSMWSYIDQMKEFIRNYGNKIKEINGRVGLVLYRDLGDEYAARKVSDLQNDTSDLLRQLDELEVDGGGDDPEATLHAAMVGMNSMNWKDGATKAIIILTDAGFHHPDLVDGSTVDIVARRSLEIDPVNIYPVVGDWLADEYRELAEKTSGQVIIYDGSDTVTALNAALTKIKNRPNAKLKIGEYWAEIGQEVTFDASDSYVVDAEITSYEWDFDGDGEFDLTTNEPVVSHVYNQQFDGYMQVRISADNDTVASMSAPVKVGIVPEAKPVPAAPAVSAKVINRSGNIATIKLSWQKKDALADRWIINMNGADLGWATGDRFDVEVTDVDLTRDVEFSVKGVTTDGYTGVAGLVEVKSDATVDNGQNPGVNQCPISFRVGNLLIYCEYRTITIFGKKFTVIVWRIAYISGR